MALKKTIQVVCAVILQKNNILAAKRSEAMPHPGYWEFPGGKVEDGESEELSLKREILEELGCDIIIEKQLPSFPYQYPDKKVILIPFICKLNGENPTPKEHEQIAWFSLGELDQLNWLPADVPIAKYLRDNLK